MKVALAGDTHDHNSFRMMMNCLPLGMDILELGVGNCVYLSVYDNKNVKSLTLTDGHELNVKHALAGGLKVNYIDYKDMPFEDNSFDVVLTVNEPLIYLSVKEHIKEIKRILRPQGFFGIIFPTEYHMDTETKKIGRNLTPVVKLLEKNGFKILREGVIKARVDECHILSRRVSNGCLN